MLHLYLLCLGQHSPVLILGHACCGVHDLTLQDAVATRPSNWYQVAVPMSAFKCQGAVPTEQLNRFELQNVNERDAFFCLDKVQILKGRGSSEGRGSGREAAGEGGSGGTGGGGGGQ